jgi:hypothetical protein
MEYEMDGDTAVFTSPKFRHFAFLAPLAAAAAPAALEWITGKVKGMFGGSPPPPEAEEGEGEEEEDAVCDAANFNSLDVSYDEEEGSISIHVPQVANMSARDQNEFGAHMAADFMGMFKNLLSSGAEVAKGYLGLRTAQEETKRPPPAQVPVFPSGPSSAGPKSGGDDGAVSEEEEEEDASSVLLPPGERFLLRKFRLGRRHKRHHRHAAPPPPSGGDVRDAANGR